MREEVEKLKSRVAQLERDRRITKEESKMLRKCFENLINWISDWDSPIESILVHWNWG